MIKKKNSSKKEPSLKKILEQKELKIKELNIKMKANLHHFVEPSPAREVSVIYHKSELKMQIVDALHNVISGIIRGAIAFHNVEIISPLPK